MNALAVVDKGADWRRLKALVLDSVSSPITKRVYNLGLDEFFARYGQERGPALPRRRWRLSALPRDLPAGTINMRISLHSLAMCSSAF
jgi:hypothetical protein